MTLGADVVSSTSGAERSGAQALPGTATFTPSTLALPGVVWGALLCVTVDFACLLIMQWVSWWGLAVMLLAFVASCSSNRDQAPVTSKFESCTFLHSFKTVVKALQRSKGIER